jgi:predicted DNA binding CopG/RHH family protein
MKKPETKNRYALKATSNNTGHLDLSGMQTVIFPNLEPSTTTISLRLPETMLNKIKARANKQHVP